MEKFKAQAKGISVPANACNHVDSNKTKNRVSSTLPDDFWDQPEAKRMVSGRYLAFLVHNLYVFVWCILYFNTELF